MHETQWYATKGPRRKIKKFLMNGSKKNPITANDPGVNIDWKLAESKYMEEISGKGATSVVARIKRKGKRIYTFLRYTPMLQQ